ncbi:MAG: UDP-N-acetylmuramoyl-L-alanyl-D-glutamate--2,6-diaminopimelate ligase [Anaerolineae bacterium]|jgi:UDP-N-acetylmuramoyl-L-alanyl-D-glutamate--2,6-diaminopimelate ligase
MTLDDIVDALPDVVEVVGQDVTVRGISADSRRVAPGDLFVAIPGTTVDGHRFVGDVAEAGAVAVVGEKAADDLDGTAGEAFSYVQVVDARRAWGWACAVWERLPARELTLIGVTGTDGKTTTVSLIHGIAGAAGYRAGMMSTVKALLPSARGMEEAETGLHTTTPNPPEVQGYLAALADRGATHAVLEVTSHGLAQHRVAGCDFDVAVVTNVTHEHLDYHGSLEAYRRAKGRLFEGLEKSFRKPGVPKLSVLNRDDDSFRHFRTYAADRCLVYSMEGRGHVTARDVRLETDRTRFELCAPSGCVQIETGLVGAYNVPNILAAASVGVGLGISLDAIAAGVASVSGVPGRMERIDEGQAFLAIVDFAHTPNALRQALVAARGMAEGDGRVIAVFGSAGLRDRDKRHMMGEIAGELADVVIVTAEDPRTESLDDIMEESARAAEAKGMRRGVDLLLVPDRGEALLTACEMARAGDVVIACGKGHEQSMCFGTTEYPWDDRKAMRVALRGETLDTLPTAGSGANKWLGEGG